MTTWHAWKRLVAGLVNPAHDSSVSEERETLSSPYVFGAVSYLCMLLRGVSANLIKVMLRCKFKGVTRTQIFNRSKVDQGLE